MTARPRPGVRDAACARAGIERCSPNDLRRTCATWLRAAGVAPDLIAPVMGHADTRMVERVYGRLSPQALATRLAAEPPVFFMQLPRDPLDNPNVSLEPKSLPDFEILEMTPQ